MDGEDRQGAAGQRDGILGRFTGFAHTRKGSVLLVEMVTSLIVFICFCASAYGGYPTAPIVELILSGIFFVIFMNQFDKSLSFIHWPWTDFIRCCLAVIIYIIISILAIVSRVGAQITGGVFGLLAATAFAYDAYLIFPSLKLRQHTRAPTEPPENTA